MDGKYIVKCKTKMYFVTFDQLCAFLLNKEQKLKKIVFTKNFWTFMCNIYELSRLISFQNSQLLTELTEIRNVTLHLASTL